jgi:hypothetical protein
MHSVIPHEHHEDILAIAEAQDHNEPNGFFDWITLAFQNDLGEGHLEHFNAADGPHLSDNLVAYAPLPMFLVDRTQLDLLASIQKHKSRFSLFDSTFRNHQYYAASLNLRGPPSLI